MPFVILVILLYLLTSFTPVGAEIMAKIFIKYPNKNSPFEDSIMSNSKQFGVDDNLIRAIIQNESSWNKDASRDDQYHGTVITSYGLMQVTPSVLSDAGISIMRAFDPFYNIQAGTRLLSGLLKRHPIDQAIQMYNLGERAYSSLGRRNQVYLNRVMGYLIAYQNA